MDEFGLGLIIFLIMINPIFILIFFKWLVQNEIDTRDYRAIEGLQMTRSLLEGCTVHYV